MADIEVTHRTVNVEVATAGIQGGTGLSGIVSSDTPPSNTEVLWADTDDNDVEVVLIPSLHGSGFPTAPASVGTRYVDVDATNGAVEWIMTPSGWEVAYGDTGWRDISSLYDLTNINNVYPPRAYIRRQNKQVMLKMWFEVKTAGNYDILTLPNNGLGFNSGPALNLHLVTPPSITGGSSQVREPALDNNGKVYLYVGVANGNWQRVNATWITDDAWPTTLPGTPA